MLIRTNGNTEIVPSVGDIATVREIRSRCDHSGCTIYFQIGTAFFGCSSTPYRYPEISIGTRFRLDGITDEHLWRSVRVM